MKKYRFRAVLRVFFGFFMLFCLLFAERRGIRCSPPKTGEALASREDTRLHKPLKEEAECLVIVDSASDSSRVAEEQYMQILQDMRVTYQLQDIENMQTSLSFDGFRSVVLLLSDVEPLGDQLLTLCDYVAEGGQVLFGIPVGKTTAFSTIQSRLGILESGHDYQLVSDFKVQQDFMLGGDRVYTIEDPYESSMNVGLDEKCRVYATTADDRVPLIWERDYGAGRFVVCNFAYCVKATRGIYAAAYSLLGDISVYPVINASSFYLDDWPSPVPSGDGQYIRRDYQMDVKTFYSQVWWPDIAAISEKYDIPFTGLIIESYDDNTDGDFPENTVVSDYTYYGNMLLDEGGELGYHGYNHQPLCGSDFHYEEDLGYHTWPSTNAMAKSITELQRFSEGLFPNTKLQVYVPPSNVLSSEGRSLLVQSFPDIRAIASCYLPSGSAYAQEFEVAEDGMVETPRIISSCVLDDYMRLTAFSELNMHLVNSHFMHPDDLLDIDRGADLGWETLKGRLTEYIEWLYRAVPVLRHETGSGMAAAVQRFSCLSVERSVTEDQVKLYLEGLTDDDYFLVRVNKGGLSEVEGGSLQHLTGNLYLLHTTDSRVTMHRTES